MNKKLFLGLFVATFLVFIIPLASANHYYGGSGGHYDNDYSSTKSYTYTSTTTYSKTSNYDNYNNYYSQPRYYSRYPSYPSGYGYLQPTYRVYWGAKPSYYGGYGGYNSYNSYSYSKTYEKTYDYSGYGNNYRNTYRYSYY